MQALTHLGSRQCRHWIGILMDLSPLVSTVTLRTGRSPPEKAPKRFLLRE